MAIAYFGLGNFLGGMSEGFQQMAKIQVQKEDNELERRRILQHELYMQKQAEQFAQAQEQQKVQFGQTLELNKSEMSQRERLAQQAQAFQYGLHMDEERQRGLDRLERNKPTTQDALLRAYLESDLLPNLPKEQADRIRGLLPAMLSTPGTTLGGTVTEGLSPYQNFYKGGILGSY